MSLKEMSLREIMRSVKVFQNAPSHETKKIGKVVRSCIGLDRRLSFGKKHNHRERGSRLNGYSFKISPVLQMRQVLYAYLLSVGISNGCSSVGL